MNQYVDKADLSQVQEKKGIVVEREIERLVATNGAVSAVSLLEAATPEDSPLHPFFEWNDDEAAKKYRLSQAYMMILASRFVVQLQESKKTPEVSSKHFVRKFLPQHDASHGFSTRQEILANDETKKSIVDRKVQVLRSWCASVVDIQELNDLRVGILALLK